jgi:hypothetical protein
MNRYLNNTVALIKTTKADNCPDNPQFAKYSCNKQFFQATNRKIVQKKSVKTASCLKTRNPKTQRQNMKIEKQKES